MLSMAERIPPGVLRYKPYDFIELEPLFYLIRQHRFRFKADNIATRTATAKDELGRAIPEISIICNFFSGLENRRPQGNRHSRQYALNLNMHLRNIRDISPLYVVMRRSAHGAAGAGQLIQFVEADDGVQPLLKSANSHLPGLPPTNAIYGDPPLVQKVGPANILPGRRR